MVAPMTTTPPSDLTSDAIAAADEALRLRDAHATYRDGCLNLIASENVVSPSVAGALAGDLEGRYADFTGTDPQARKYRGGRYVVEIEALCAELVRRTFNCDACELRAISGHVAGNAVLMAVCHSGDLVMEVGQEGGGHRLAAKLAEAPLIDLDVEFLPFDPLGFNIDTAAAVARIEERRPRMIILGSSTFLHPHPVAELASVCRAVGAVLAYDASHVMGLLAAGRFQDPLREGADIVFGSTHKTLFGPQGGLIFGREELVAAASSALYPPLVTNHHPFRIPALCVALAEHLAFGEPYAAAVVANARAFAAALEAAGLTVAGGGTDSHAVLLATPERSGGDAARLLEQQGIIVNQSRLPSELGGEGVRFGLQELTRRSGREPEAVEAAALVSDALSGLDVRGNVSQLADRLDRVDFTWTTAR
jgi:glycine hydroxymethyltransferase